MVDLLLNVTQSKVCVMETTAHYTAVFKRPCRIYKASGITPDTWCAFFQMSVQGLSVSRRPDEANIPAMTLIRTLMLIASPMAAPISAGVTLVFNMLSKMLLGKP